MIEELKNLLLDQPSQQEKTPLKINRRQRSPRQINPHNPRRECNRQNQQMPTSEKESYTAAWIALFVFTPIVMYILLGTNPPPPIPIDPTTLCPIDKTSIVRKNYILVDLSESLSKNERSSLQQLLNSVAKKMLPREFLSISQLQSVQNAPRKEVQHFCSPDITRIGDAGRRVGTNDCNNIVNQDYIWNRNVRKNTRDNITFACENYLDLQNKVDEAAKLYGTVNVEQPQSYIVGGIEDALESVANESNSAHARLIIFSDMVQNASWFSQYDVAPNEWTIENLLEKRSNSTSLLPQPINNFNEVLICYLPDKNNILTTAYTKKQHRQMWQRYFSKTTFEYAEASGCAVAAGEMLR